MTGKYNQLIQNSGYSCKKYALSVLKRAFRAGVIIVQKKLRRLIAPGVRNEYLLGQLRLSKLHVNCIHAFFALLCFECNGVALANFAYDATYVDKNLFAGGRVNDETKAFCGVEKFYCASTHEKKEKSDVVYTNHEGTTLSANFKALVRYS